MKDTRTDEGGHIALRPTAAIMRRSNGSGMRSTRLHSTHCVSHEATSKLPGKHDLRPWRKTHACNERRNPCGKLLLS